METKIQKTKKENNQLTSKKIESQLELLLKSQEINQKVLKWSYFLMIK